MIDLQQFCNTDDVRFYMHKPFSVNGKACATDGCMVICMDGDTDIEPLSANLKKPELIANKLMEYCDASKFVDGFVPLKVEIPPYPLCHVCLGDGKVAKEIECPECDGEGEVNIGKHYYECKECDGSGNVPSEGKDAEKTIVCEKCNGSGKGYHSIDLDDRKFQAKYLEKILGLPNIEYKLMEGKTEMMRFKFDGGVGCLMPTT
ncbi:MAG: hypothetical protein WC714_29040 [Candidatus Obscuribacterales bacterium]|jgi:hypothetical protein